MELQVASLFKKQVVSIYILVLQRPIKRKLGSCLLFGYSKAKQKYLGYCCLVCWAANLPITVEKQKIKKDTPYGNTLKYELGKVLYAHVYNLDILRLIMWISRFTSLLITVALSV